MKTMTLAALLLAGTTIAGCVPPDIGGPALPPPVIPYNPDKIGTAIEEAGGSTPQTTIYTNVLNGSGGSCVEAATNRGTAIADKLGDMKTKGEIPPDHTIEVHTYSGYRVPGWDYSSLHTYTVTQVRGPDGKVKDTWTSDNYLGPNSTTHLPGDGGYTNWGDPLTGTVNPSNTPPKPPKPRTGGSGGGGGGAGGGGGGGGGEG